MTIRDIRDILEAKVLWADEEILSHEVHTACCSDMMIDVLAFVKDQAVLITGLVNPQVIRTAEMMDIICIVFVLRIIFRIFVCCSAPPMTLKKKRRRFPLPPPPFGWICGWTLHR